MPDPCNSNIATHPRYEYKYDDFGNMTEQWDYIKQYGDTTPTDYTAKRITSFTYDELNRQTSRTLYFGNVTEAKTESWQYDQHGRMEVHIDFKGQTEGHFYDSLGRLQYKRYYETLAAWQGTPDTGWKLQYEYHYDGLGRNWKVVESDDDLLTNDRIEEYVFDAEGRVITVISPEGTIEYSYDPITGVKRSTTSPNTETLYSYDSLGRLDTVTRPGSDPVQYRYDAVGNRDSTTLPNQVHTKYTYDELNRLTDMRHLKTPSVTDVLSSYVYTPNARGARIGVTESVDEGHNIIYNYDNAYRLTYEENQNSDDEGYKANYVYDLVGNRLQRQVKVDNLSGTGTLTTEYTYYPGTDKLHYEQHRDDVAFAALPWGNGGHAYACNDSGGITYQVPGQAGRVGQVGAFFLGLPSVWNRYILIAVLVGLAAVILWPLARAAWYRLRSSGWQMRRNTRVALRGGLCVLLAYIFLVGPEWFNNLAQASIEYSNLSTLAWGAAGDTIEYGYDANGSLISKVTRNGSSVITESRAYEYDLRGRLVREVDTNLTPDSPADDTQIAEFAYDSSGIRVKKIDHLASTATYYLIDKSNHTGYAQVLEERTFIIGTGGTETLDAAVYYTIGDDVVSQTKAGYVGETWTVYDTQYLLYDGHGSTRQLLNHTLGAGDEPVVTESYDYDAYGVMLGSGTNPKPADAAGTNLLYSGEQYDSSLSQYYLRARYYDQSNGRFTTLDPFAGNTSDPQSLHKYTYCHNDPVNGMDPSGMDITLMGRTVVTAIQSVFMKFCAIAMGAYIWAGTNMALITAVSYYAMWTFIGASLWVGMEDQGYVPRVTVVGNWTVARALQVISGAAFYMGLMIMATVPDMEQARLARDIQIRVAELRKQLGRSHNFGTTMAVGVAETPEKNRIILLATSENTGGGLYLRSGVVQKPNEILVSGIGHAEERIVHFCQGLNYRLLAVGASRDICLDICVPAINGMGADVVTPVQERHIVGR